MTAKEEIALILTTMTRRTEALNGRIPCEEIAWFKGKLWELNYHVNRMFAAA